MLSHQTKRIEQKKKTPRTKDNELTVMSCIGTSEIEAPAHYRSKIEIMIAEYKPKKNIETPVETKIILKDFLSATAHVG